jgi:hypothetical protein
MSSLQFLAMLGGARLRNERVTSVSRRDEIFEWSRDFPVSLQSKTPDGYSVFDLEFELTDEEIVDFKSDVGSSLNGTLPIQLKFGVNDSIFTVTKQGKGGQSLTKKAQAIARFVARHLHIAYIPAVRTALAAERVVSDLVERELTLIEKTPEYQSALREIAQLQAPVLERISESVRESLQEFLPNVRDVKVDISTDARYRALRRSCEVVIDDGTATRLDKKGDGVQSLAALSLIKYASHSSNYNRNLILAIEEPESHLHPRAIHQLRDVLVDLSAKHQVILTTHCPLFVDRGNVRSNILVDKKKAVAASSIGQIRDSLGVRAADNLRSAEVVLVVEGEDDRGSLAALFSNCSSRLSQALRSGLLAIDSLGGGSNLCYKLGQLRDALCTCHVLLDDDRAGKEAFKKAEAEGLIGMADVTHVVCPGQQESEFEDMIDVSVYEKHFLETYGVSLASQRFKGRSKWSDRLRETFSHQGKLWSAQIERRVKVDVMNLVVDNPGDALSAYRRNSFDALVAALEGKLMKAEIRNGKASVSE